VGELTYARAVLLGAIQGLTEFLPVSSSGHLVLAQALLGIELPGLHLEIMLHVGTALAVALVFRHDLLMLGRALFGFRRTDPYWGLGMRLIVATIPAALAGLLLSERAEGQLARPQLAAGMLIVTAVVLFYSKTVPQGARSASTMTWAAALLVGSAQAVAILPGLSRSGMTVVAALLIGLRRDDAARFSLLLSLPVIAGGALADLAGLRGSLAAGGLAGGPMLAGVLVSLAFGVFAVQLLVRAVQHGRLGVFAAYCLALGGLSLALLSRF
jgi:undecaprenyl-diphosphatase